MFDTIVALATPPLKSALAIVRLSGDDCFEIVEKFFSKKLENYKNNCILHGYVKENDDFVDEVVLLLYHGPHSFTGEDSVEIMCHGSPLIFNKIISLAIKSGARMALGGEYSSRAFMHGKLNLMQAESINDLINAESEESKRLSLMSLRGKTSELITPIKEDFSLLLSNIEVNIDYPEYKDIEEANYSKIIEICSKNFSYISNLIKDGEKGKVIKDGVNVVLVGKPNVGKSSILNALINEDKAIVTDIKGTTRDVVEGKTIINGLLVNLFDTAGIRESDDLIENIGIKKSLSLLDRADLVVMVLDSKEMDVEDKEVYDKIKGKKHIIVYNKSDIKNTNISKHEICISALKKDIQPLKDAIFSSFSLQKDNFIKASICNARELGILQSINEDLKETINNCNNKIPIDLISIGIKDIYLKILSLTGEDNDFDMASEIFSHFCVGK